MPVMSLLARLRELHRSVAPFVLAPLLVTVFSGVSYRLARDWFGAVSYTHLTLPTKRIV